MATIKTFALTMLAGLLLCACGGENTGFSLHTERLNGERARHYLQLLDKQNKCDTVFSSDTLQQTLVRYFNRHGTNDERMLAYYLLGRACYDMGEASRALDCYLQAAACADTTSADCDHAMLLRIYSQTARLFHLQGLLNENREALASAERCAWKIHDTLHAISLREHQIDSYYLESNYDKVIDICLWASSAYEKAGFASHAAEALFSAIYIYIERGNFAEAIPLLERYEKESGRVQDGKALPGYELYYYERGTVELHLNNVRSAESCFRNLLADDGNYNNLQAGYRGLLSVYDRLGVADSVSKYARLYAAATDSSYKERTATEVSRVNALYRYDKAKHEALRSRERLHRLYYTSASMFLFLLASFVLVYHVMRTRKDRDLCKLRLVNQHYNHLLSEYKTFKTAQSVLSEKNSTLEDYYQQEIDNLRSELNTYLCDGNDLDETAEMSGIDIISRFRKLAVCVKEEPTSRDWNGLYLECERLYPGFLQMINNFTVYDLNKIEKQICVLLKMRFTKSEAGVLLGISSQSVTNYGARINKKLFNKTGAKGLEFNIRCMK